ncbi:MAG TPA: SIMPL domain-containing protein [Thermoanaerobaculia bacterium]|jgi:uncharacterized protein YggE
MKRFLFAALIATSALAQPQPQPPMETVTVTGNGHAVVTPDRFTFQVGVQTVAATVDEAVTENNRRVATVIAALKKAGAQDKDIQTSQFSIYPQQDYQQGKLPRILGYQVSNNITVRSVKVGDAGRLLGIAVNAGVNTSSGINFEVSDPARGRDQGLRAAFEDARAKAALLAQAAGRTLGRAIEISEGQRATQEPPRPMMRTMAMEAQVAGDVPVESGSQEVGYVVTVTFELR